MKRDLVIIGGGGHAKVVISIAKRIKDFHLLGYVDKEDKGKILGIDYLGDDEVLPLLKKRCPEFSVVLGIGSVEVSNKRQEIQRHMHDLGYTFPPIISPTAVINEDVEIGAGTVIMDGVVINAGVKIGKFCIINTNSSIDHDCDVGDFVHVCPGVTLSGGVTVGQNTLIGSGSTVIQYRKIGRNCLIAAGATVVEDCLVAATYLGSPACRRI